MYLFDTEYVQFTKKLSYEQGYGYLDALRRRQVKLIVPSEKLQVSSNHAAPCFHSSPNMSDQNTNDVNKENGVCNDFLTEEEMRTRGKGMILRPRPQGHGICVSDPSCVKYNNIQRRLPHGVAVEDMLSVKKVEVIDNMKTARIVSSARPKSCAGTFKTSDFHHFCLGEQFELDDETQLQRQINAAIDIQKIFRGHMVRRYMKELKSNQLQRTKKRSAAIFYAEKKYRQHIRQLREDMEYREPNMIDFEFEKKYKAQKKQQELDRKQKQNYFLRRQAMLQAKHLKLTKKQHASDNIYEIFHNNGPSKGQMRQAAIQIQRIARGWLVRKHMHKSKEKAMKRTLDFGGFIHNVYMTHLEKIVRRYGIENSGIVLQFHELLEYIDKRNKFEVEFDRIASKKEKKIITFVDVKTFFAACGLFPSKDEMLTAVRTVLREKGVDEHENHSYSKADMVDIAFQIYVPRGTKLENTRKSTWMNPLVNGEEAVKLIGKKGMEETNFEHCLEIVQKIMRERRVMKEEAVVADLLPENAKREGFQEYVPQEEKPQAKVSKIKKR